MNNLQLDSTKALYIQIKDRIKKKILAGELKEGEKIPSERELCDMFGVSRITVRQAIKEGVEEGFLFSVQGKGTYVAKRDEFKIGQDLIQFTTFQSTVRSRGFDAGTRIVGYRILPVDFALAKILNLDLSDQVFNLNIIGTANDEHFVFYDSYFQAMVGQKFYNEALKKAEEGVAFSTFDLYKFIDGPALSYAEQTLEALEADEEVAEMLKVKPGSAVLLVTSIFYNEDNQPIEYKKAYYRANRYKFHIKRKIEIEKS